MDNFLKGLQDIFIARVKNMLLLNFIIAWAIVNYDIMFFVLFDDMTISHKILYIQNVPIGLWKGIFLPIIVAAFYIYLIPLLNLLIVIPYNKYINSKIKKHKNDMLKEHYKAQEEVERIKLQNTEFLKDTMKLELESQAVRFQEVNNKAQEEANRLKEIENKEKEQSIKLAKKENDEKERKIELAKEEEKILNKENKDLKKNLDLLKIELDKIQKEYENQIDKKDKIVKEIAKLKIEKAILNGDLKVRKNVGKAKSSSDEISLEDAFEFIDSTKNTGEEFNSPLNDAFKHTFPSIDLNEAYNTKNSKVKLPKIKIDKDGLPYEE